MIVAQFNLTTLQLQFLLTFRRAQDTRLTARDESHPSHEVGRGHYVPIVNKLTREGYLQHHDGRPVEGVFPGYSITPKGEMMLRVVEEELRRNIAFFDENPEAKKAVAVDSKAPKRRKA